MIREIVKFEITICKFANRMLSNYKQFPRGIRGSHNIINHRTDENCVLISLATFMYLKQDPNIEPAILVFKISRNPRKFWQNRINIGILNNNSIGWESLSQLEKLKVSFNIYSLFKQNHNKSKYCFQLVHHSRSDYE